MNRAAPAALSAEMAPRYEPGLLSVSATVSVTFRTTPNHRPARALCESVPDPLHRRDAIVAQCRRNDALGFAAIWPYHSATALNSRDNPL